MTVAEESTDNAAGADSISTGTNGAVEGSDEFGEQRAKVKRMGSISEAAEEATAALAASRAEEDRPSRGSEARRGRGKQGAFPLG